MGIALLPLKVRMIFFFVTKVSEKINGHFYEGLKNGLAKGSHLSQPENILFAHSMAHFPSMC